MTEEQPQEHDEADAGPCSACRGGGVVISGLGGESLEMPCPWCEGTGRRLRAHDAQAHWREH